MKLTFRALALCDFMNFSSFSVSCFHLPREMERVFISFLISPMNTTIVGASIRLRLPHAPLLCG